MSVQASNFHNSKLAPDGVNYESVEIGFPSEIENLIVDYAESPHDLMGTVYSYVPTYLVEKVITKHGGFLQETEMKISVKVIETSDGKGHKIRARWRNRSMILRHNYSQNLTTDCIYVATKLWEKVRDRSDWIIQSWENEGFENESGLLVTIDVDPEYNWGYL